MSIYHDFAAMESGEDFVDFVDRMEFIGVHIFPVPSPLLHSSVFQPGPSLLEIDFMLYIVFNRFENRLLYSYQIRLSNKSK